MDQNRDKNKNTRFRVGDVVMMNPKSEHAEQSYGKNGIVVETKVENDWGYVYRVKWEHGKGNAYRERDILSVEIEYDIY